MAILEYTKIFDVYNAMTDDYKTSYLDQVSLTWVIK